MDRRTSVTIHSDGFGGVVVTEDGKKLENVRDATIWLEAGEATRVDLTFIMMPLNVTGGINEVTFECPVCSDSHSHECRRSD